RPAALPVADAGGAAGGGARHGEHRQSRRQGYRHLGQHLRHGRGGGRCVPCRPREAHGPAGGRPVPRRRRASGRRAGGVTPHASPPASKGPSPSPLPASGRATAYGGSSHRVGRSPSSWTGEDQVAAGRNDGSSPPEERERG